jgi:hypothetical protein
MKRQKEWKREKNERKPRNVFERKEEKINTEEKNSVH